MRVRARFARVYEASFAQAFALRATFASMFFGAGSESQIAPFPCLSGTAAQLIFGYSRVGSEAVSGVAERIFGSF